MAGPSVDLDFTQMKPELLELLRVLFPAIVARLEAVEAALAAGGVQQSYVAPGYVEEGYVQ